MIGWIVLFLIFAIWLYFTIRRSATHKHIIGKKVVVKYFDQNTDFETIFPLTGIVTEKIRVGSQNFFVVQFDEPFFYRGRDFQKIAIKERHVGKYIGGNGEIHVHVCLPKKELHQNHYELADFDQAVWATVQKL